MAGYDARSYASRILQDDYDVLSETKPTGGVAPPMENASQPAAKPPVQAPAATQPTPVSNGIVYDPDTDTLVDTATSKIIQYNVKKGVQPNTQMTSNQLSEILKQQQDATRIREQEAADARLKARMAAIDAQLQKTKASLSKQKADVDPQVYAQKLAVTGEASTAARRLAERLSELGLTRSGAMERGQTNIETEQIGNIAAAEQAGAKRKMDISALESEAEIAAAADASSAAYDIDSQRLAALNAMMASGDDKLFQIAKEELTKSEALTKEEKTKAEARDIATIGQYSKDYTAEAQRRAAINPNDPLIPYLNAAARDKEANLKAEAEAKKAAEATSQEAKNRQLYEDALKMWETKGVADSYVAAVLGVKVGDKTQDKSYKDSQVALEAQRNAISAADNARIRAEEKKAKEDEYSEFLIDMRRTLTADPSRAQALIRANKDAIVDFKGANAYKKLLEETEKAIVNKLKSSGADYYKY